MRSGVKKTKNCPSLYEACWPKIVFRQNIKEMAINWLSPCSFSMEMEVGQKKNPYWVGYGTRDGILFLDRASYLIM